MYRTPFFKATPLFRRPCNVDQSAMAAGRTEKPTWFWRVGACSLIPWQSTDMQRLRQGMKAKAWDAVLYLSMFSANLVFKWRAILIKVLWRLAEWRNLRCLEGWSLFSDPLAVD